MTPTRRSFLSSSLVTAATLAAPARAIGANERVRVAVVGVNGMGHFHVQTLSTRKDVTVAALCDVDPAPLARAAKTVKDAAGAEPALVRDFRTLLDDKAIDAVVIATPHHWHAPIALRAVGAFAAAQIPKPER